MKRKHADIAENWPSEEYCMAGEWNGLPIEGFSYPLPLALKEKVADKTLILERLTEQWRFEKPRQARKVWIASLLNSPAVARKVS